MGFMDVFNDMRMQYLLRLGWHEDELGIILKGHLIVEYLLNRIIENKLSGSNRKLSSHFSYKVDILCKHKLLPTYLQKNINHLNMLRNGFAHQLDYEITPSSMLFTKDSGESMQVRVKRGRYPERYYCKNLCHGILTQLTNHILISLGLDPFWRNEAYSSQ